MLPITILSTPSLLMVTFCSYSRSIRVEAKIGWEGRIPSSNTGLHALGQVLSLCCFFFYNSMSRSNIRSKTSFESLLMTLVCFLICSSASTELEVFVSASEWNLLSVGGGCMLSSWPYFSAEHYCRLSEAGASKFRLLYYKFFVGYWTVTLVRFERRSLRRYPRVFLILYYSWWVLSVPASPMWSRIESICFPINFLFRLFRAPLFELSSLHLPEFKSSPWDVYFYGEERGAINLGLKLKMWLHEIFKYFRGKEFLLLSSSVIFVSFELYWLVSGIKRISRKDLFCVHDSYDTADLWICSDLKYRLYGMPLCCAELLNGHASLRTCLDDDIYGEFFDNPNKIFRTEAISCSDDDSLGSSFCVLGRTWLMRFLFAVYRFTLLRSVSQLQTCSSSGLSKSYFLQISSSFIDSASKFSCSCSGRERVRLCRLWFV